MQINQNLKTNFYKLNTYEKNYSLCNQNNKDTISFKGNLSKAFTKLSVPTSITPQGREYKIISLPKSMDILGNLSEKSQVSTVAIIDMFGKKSGVKVGHKARISHGDLVTKYLTNGLEDKIGIFAYDLTPTPQHSKNVHENLADALVDLAEIQQKQKNITALNLSVGECFDFERLYDEFKIDINPDNIQQHKNNILNALQASKNPRLKNTHRAIQAINSLADNGVQVYCCSGNIGNKGVNLFTLSNAQHIVSAKDYSNASQLFATDFSDAKHSFRKIFDKDNKLIQITDDKITLDLDEIQTKSPFKTFWEKLTSKSSHTIEGTSYSTPIQLNSDLRKIFIQPSV